MSTEITVALCLAGALVAILAGIVMFDSAIDAWVKIRAERKTDAVDGVLTHKVKCAKLAHSIEVDEVLVKAAAAEIATWRGFESKEIGPYQLHNAKTLLVCLTPLIEERINVDKK